MAGYTKISVDYDRITGLLGPRRKLQLSGVALGIVHLPSDEGYSFLHSHEEQEEVYIVIRGSGCMQVDEDMVELAPGDFVRVSPSAHRALKAGPSGLVVVCAGGVAQGYPRNPQARYMIDDGIPHYDELPVWYLGNSDIIEKNSYLKERMEKSRRKRENRE